MSTKKQKRKGKEFGIKRVFNSFKYTMEGLTYAYTNEQSLMLHGIVSILVIITGILLQISFIQWAIIVLAAVVVLAIELLNTAIEATVDMVTKEYNEYAKIAKDCGSAAAGVSSLAYAGICLFIFIEKLIEILSLI